jgi:sirohydrochlorin cobaltochelatase
LPFVEPDLSGAGELPAGSEPHRDDELAATIAALIRRDTGLQASNHRYVGWLGVDCPSVRFAVWMMRALVASNVLSRREGTVLFVPGNRAADPDGTIVANTVGRVYRYASARGLA